MEEKRCTGCGVVKKIDEFNFQKRNPTRRYAWCTACQVVGSRTRLYSQEVRTLREKSKSLRNLTEDKIELVKKYRSEDLKPQTIAARLGVPEIVITRTLKRLDKLAV